MGKVISTVGAVITSPFVGKLMDVCNKYNPYGALHPNLGHFGSGCDGVLEVGGGYASAGGNF